jgi:integrase
MAYVKKLPTGKYQARWREYPSAPEQARNFDLEREAKAFAVKVENAKLTGSYVDPKLAETPFDEYVKVFVERQVWRDRTRMANKLMLDRAVDQWKGRPLGSIRTGDARALIARLSQTYAPSTVGVNYDRVKSVFSSAIEDGLIGRNPFAGVPRPRGRKGKVRPLTVDQVAALYDAAEDDFKLAVALAATAGVRASEARGLTLDRVHFIQSELVIDRQAAHGSAAFVPPKSANSDRVVPVDDTLLADINRHVGEYGTGDDGVLLFGAQTNRMHSYGQWGTKWDRARTKAGLPGVRYHDLRHHYISEMLSHGVSPVAVAAAVGDTPAVIFSVYGHLTASDDDRIRAVMRGLWTDASAPLNEIAGA